MNDATIDLAPFGLSAPLPEIVYGRLRLDILNGVLRPGQLLRQEELSRRFAVSRVPLREAMSRLAADGLITLRPRRGYAVTSLEPAEILEIFELRAVVEAHAGAIAALARTPGDIAKVRDALETMEKLDPRAPSYLADWLRANYAFHAGLIASTRREHLARHAGTLRDAVEPYIRVELQMTGDVTEAGQDHRDIFDAFRTGDAARLAALSGRHVEHTAQRLLQGLRADTGKQRKPRRELAGARKIGRRAA
jgi:DNA-binding GntR family transcriptional regulator